MTEGIDLCFQAIRRFETSRGQTRFIVFLGTPHRGSEFASWGEIASNLATLALQDPHKKIVEALEVNSEVLDNIHDEFVQVAIKQGIRMHSFQEGRGMSGVSGLHGKVRFWFLQHAASDLIDSYWHVQVVSDFSSKLGLPNIETIESLDTDHRQMARCKDRSDENYRAIVGVLKQFLKRESSSANLPLRPDQLTQQEETPSAQQEADTG